MSLMKIRERLVSLGTLVQDAHRNGAIVNRFRLTPDEVKRIRRVEKRYGQGGPEGLKVVLQILREKNELRARLS